MISSVPYEMLCNLLIDPIHLLPALIKDDGRLSHAGHTAHG